MALVGIDLGTTNSRIDIRHTIVVTNVIMHEFPTMGDFGLGGQMFG